MTRRFVTYLRALRAELNATGHFDVLNKLKDHMGPAAYPTMDDHKETIESLLAVQQFYDPKPIDLSKGLILTVQTNVSLNALHCLEIGKFASEIRQYTMSLPWLRAAKALNKGSNLISDEELDSEVKKLIERHDSAYDPELLKGLFFFEQKLSNDISSRTMRELKLRDYFGIRPSGHESYDSDVSYYNLINTESERKSLFCYLERMKHPLFIINPIKVEVLSNDPYAIMMYQAIPKYYVQELWGLTASVSLINTSISPAYLDFNFANIDKTTRVPEDPREGVTHRIVPAAKKAQFLDEHLGPDFVERMEMLSGLHIKGDASDKYVINNYLHGNPLQMHCDHLYGLNDPTQPIKGHRLASLMLYMTDVELIGGTAFPNLGFRAKAEAGSVLFWHAAHPNGEIDFRTAHEGCYAPLGLRSSLYVNTKTFLNSSVV